MSINLTLLLIDTVVDDVDWKRRAEPVINVLICVGSLRNDAALLTLSLTESAIAILRRLTADGARVVSGVTGLSMKMFA